VLFQNKINLIYCASGWIYYGNMLRCTVLQICYDARSCKYVTMHGPANMLRCTVLQICYDARSYKYVTMHGPANMLRCTVLQICYDARSYKCQNLKLFLGLVFAEGRGIIDRSWHLTCHSGTVRDDNKRLFLKVKSHRVRICAVIAHVLVLLPVGPPPPLSTKCR